MKSVRPGDSVYVSGPSGPCVGKVVCHGKHGATVEFDGRRAPVKWEHILGHKERLGFGARVIDQGDDGAIVEDDNGQRHYMAGLGFEEPEPEPEPTGWEMALNKAMVLFFKGFPAKGEDQEDGEQAGPEPDQTAEVGRAKGDTDAAPEIKPGTMVLFLSAEGDKLKGSVVASGADGVTVEDDRGGEHRIEHGDYRPDDGESDDEEPAEDGETPEPEDDDPAS